jgi:hypothetical protein
VSIPDNRAGKEEKEERMSTDTANKKNCDYNTFKRTRYFHGMLLTERDFQEEQLYHQEKRKLLNRKLHGWGVVCGLGVKATTPESSRIVITPGMALDCLGNEIVVCHDFEINLKKFPDLYPSEGEKAMDPCVETEGQDCKYYIGIKYTEAPTDPVPVYVPGGSCEEKTCEYSRVREGYCVKLFKSPPCHAVGPQDGLFERIAQCRGDASCVKKVLQAFQTSFCQQPHPCPVCCCDGDPYVILGSLDLKATNCRVTTISQDMIDINDERRYVLTSMLWQYYLGSFFPQINEFLDNPFILLCKALGRLPERPGFLSISTLSQTTSVSKVSEDQAKADLEKHDLKYNKTVTLTPGTAFNLAARVIAVEEIKPGTLVDLITDSSGQVLFQVPAEAPPEKVKVEALRREMSEKIKALAKQHTDELKKIDTKYRRKLDDLNQEITDLKKKLPQ